MNAVNLIPADQRRNTSVAGRSGGAVYVLLGTMSVLVILVGLYGLAVKSINDRTAEIADVTARANAAEATAKSLSAYTDFAQMRKERTDTIKALADGRTDWAHILSEIARTLPANSRLTTLRGSTGQGPSAGGAAASTATTPTAGGATPAPSINLGGCTTGHSAVSTLMADLRRIDGVTAVTLSSSAKGAAGGTAPSGSSSGSTSGGGCSGAGSTTFAMNLSFKAPVSGASTTAQTATAGSAK